MSHRTFSDLLIRLEALKRIFVFGPKIHHLPRGNPTVLGQKCLNFQVDIFYSFRSLGIWACRKMLLEIFLKCKQCLGKELKEFSVLPLSRLYLCWAISLFLVPWET